jgi:hypothetical protein
LCPRIDNPCSSTAGTRRDERDPGDISQKAESDLTGGGALCHFVGVGKAFRFGKMMADRV